MSKSAKSEDRKKAGDEGQLWLRLPGLVRDALYETLIGAGLACVDEVLEAERVALCGGRYSHLASGRRCGPVTPRVPWCWTGGGLRCPAHGSVALPVTSSSCQHEKDLRTQMLVEKGINEKG